MRHPNFNLICFGIVVAAGAWGLYWIPQRAFDEAGMTGGWATIAQFFCCTLLLLPIALWRWLKCLQTGFGLPAVGLMMGGGIVCYANSFFLTDVIRALLLFYLMPLWATVIEVGLMRKSLGLRRIVSLPLALSGVWIVIGNEAGLPVPQNLGDWLAVAAGALFASGAAKAEVSDAEGIFPLLFSFFFYGAIFAALQALVLTDELGSLPTGDIWIMVAPWIALICICFFIPSMALVSWAPEHIGVGLLSILFLAELLFGTISAGLLTGEPFGWREIVGSSLILLSGVSEVFFTPKESSNR